MNTPLPKKIGESVPAVLPVVVEMVDAWGFLHIKPAAALGVELPHMLPPRLLPAFLNIVGAAEIGLAGSVYNVRVEITRESTLLGADVYKLSGEMEGISWQNIPAAAVLAACLDAV
jgi:hypothetical protein